MCYGLIDVVVGGCGGGCDFHGLELGLLFWDVLDMYVPDVNPTSFCLCSSFGLLGCWMWEAGCLGFGFHVCIR